MSADRTGPPTPGHPVPRRARAGEVPGPDAGGAMTGRRVRGGVRTVAVFEAAKGLVVLAAGFGLLGLVHKDVQAVAERVAERMHLNPAKHYPHIFLEAASRMTDARLWVLAWLALCYAGLRLAEAYGLWRERTWAEWFAVISGGIYVPIEIYELTRDVTWVTVCTLVINVGIVVYMLTALRRARRPSAAGPG